jgi:hypothetical protein
MQFAEFAVADHRLGQSLARQTTIGKSCAQHCFIEE